VRVAENDLRDHRQAVGIEVLDDLDQRHDFGVSPSIVAIGQRAVQQNDATLGRDLRLGRV
jgi:hypothetical protein